MTVKRPCSSEAESWLGQWNVRLIEAEPGNRRTRIRDKGTNARVHLLLLVRLCWVWLLGFLPVPTRFLRFSLSKWSDIQLFVCTTSKFQFKTILIQQVHKNTKSREAKGCARVEQSSASCRQNSTVSETVIFHSCCYLRVAIDCVSSK